MENSLVNKGVEILQYIKKFLLAFSHSIIGVQRTIKIREYVKGLYRYPKKMIGRNIAINEINRTDILVFATHPDDEVLGLSATIGRHCSQDEKVTVVYVTDGSGRDGDSWKRERKLSERIAATRYQEGVRGLSVLKIPQRNVLCLGFPDGGTHRYLKEMSKDVISLIKKLAPKKVYVHCIEGGHNDHDLVSLVVKSVCNELNFQNIFEWAEYNPLYPLGTEEIKFLPSLPFHKAKEIKIEFSEDELIFKKEMLACHKSQDVVDIFTQGEIIRKANVTHLKEELVAYSQVIKKDWSYLVERYLKYMRNKNLHTESLKTKSPRKQAVRRI